MRGIIIAIVVALTTATGSASVYVSASDKAHAEHVKRCFTREIAQAKLAGTYDLRVVESIAAVSSRRVEITIELRIAISDREGRLKSIARASANASGSHKAISALREQATADAIEVAIERVRAAR